MSLGTLPPPPDWRDKAACADDDVDPEIFFPTPGGDVFEPKKVCARCTVREQCLDFALANGEDEGVWGGLSEKERQKLKRRMQRSTHQKAYYNADVMAGGI